MSPLDPEMVRGILASLPTKPTNPDWERLLAEAWLRTWNLWPDRSHEQMCTRTALSGAPGFGGGVAVKGAPDAEA